MRNSTTFLHMNSRNTGGDEEKEQKESEGIPNSTQRSYLTIPSRFDGTRGGVHGMWSRQPSVLSPPFAPLSPFLTHAYTHTDERILLSLSFLLPLRLSLHPSADQGTFHSAQGMISPGPRANRGRSLSTLVINTNCSIQTFKMCLTFLWHVIPSLPRSLF